MSAGCAEPHRVIDAAMVAAHVRIVLAVEPSINPLGHGALWTLAALCAVLSGHVGAAQFVVRVIEGVAVDMAHTWVIDQRFLAYCRNEAKRVKLMGCLVRCKPWHRSYERENKLSTSNE